MDSHSLVCLNDGRCTRFNVSSTGTLTVLDLIYVSSSLAGACHWDIWEGSTVGSDPFPIICKISKSRNL